MKVNGYKTERVEVEIMASDVLDKIQNTWLASIKRHGQELCNGKWEQEAHTSHSWTQDMGPATEDEIRISEAFRTVRDIMKSAK